MEADEGVFVLVCDSGQSTEQRRRVGGFLPKVRLIEWSGGAFHVTTYSILDVLRKLERVSHSQMCVGNISWPIRFDWAFAVYRPAEVDSTFATWMSARCGAERGRGLTGRACAV
jgi:hypothetical protein